MRLDSQVEGPAVHDNAGGDSQSYWLEQLESLRQWRQDVTDSIPEGEEANEDDWAELEHVAFLERFAQACLELGRKNGND